MLVDQPISLVEHHRPLLARKMDADERVVRQALVKAWTRVLEKYSQPGASLPPADLLQQELMSVGVPAAVQAVVEQHWFVFDWMIEDQVRDQVGKGLEKFDLPDLMEDVKVAQTDPGMLSHLKEKIHYYVMEEP